VRHLAYLHAVPEGSKKSRLGAFLESSEGGESSFIKFPDIDGAEYLIALFHEAGPMIPTGMGPVPLTWQEIDSWLRCTNLSLSNWEKITIKELSEAYVSELNKATAKDASSPFVPPIEPDEIDRTAVSDKIGSILRGFKRKP
jgi:hypothetical protein